jgi:hypothetical protein
MLSQRLGVPPSVHRLFPYLTERWDGKGELKRLRGEEIPLPLRIVHVARDATFQHLLGGAEYAAGVARARRGRLRSRHRRAARRGGRRHPGPRRGAARVGGGPRRRARPGADPRWPGRRGSPGRDGRLRRPRLHLPGGARGRRRRAGGGGGAAPRPTGRGRGGGPARRAGPRRGARRRLGPDLAEGRPADAGRVGASQAARLPLGAGVVPLPVPRRSRADRQLSPRADGRLRVPPGSHGGRPAAGCAPARRRGRRPRDDRAPPAPRGAAAAAGRRPVQPGGPRGAAGRRQRRRGAQGGRARRSPAAATGRADRAGGGGSGPARTGPADQADRPRSGHLRQDRRPPRAECRRQDRGLDAGGGCAVRHAARPRRMGRTPDGDRPRPAPSVTAEAPGTGRVVVTGRRS